MITHHLRIIQVLAKSIAVDGNSFGKIADDSMPFKRPTKSEAMSLGHRIRFASVLLVLIPENGEWCIALMKRPEYPGVHSGQISIPGGEEEDSDADSMETALREFEEEMGIAIDRNAVFAEMTERYIPPSKFVVTPFLAVFEEEPSWEIDETEVSEVLIVPVQNLLRDNALANTEIPMASGQVVTLPAYNIGGHVIWGATAIMLAEFVAAWKSSFSDPEAATICPM